MAFFGFLINYLLQITTENIDTWSAKDKNTIPSPLQLDD